MLELRLEREVGLPAVLGVPEARVEPMVVMGIERGVGAGMILATGLATGLLLSETSSGSALEAGWPVGVGFRILGGGVRGRMAE